MSLGRVASGFGDPLQGSGASPAGTIPGTFFETSEGREFELSLIDFDRCFFVEDFPFQDFPAGTLEYQPAWVLEAIMATEGSNLSARTFAERRDFESLSKRDVWALGIDALEMLTEIWPGSKDWDREWVRDPQRFLQACFAHAAGERRLPLSRGPGSRRWAELARDFVLTLLANSVDLVPSAETALGHPFLKEIEVISFTSEVSESPGPPPSPCSCRPSRPSQSRSSRICSCVLNIARRLRTLSLC